MSGAFSKRAQLELRGWKFTPVRSSAVTSDIREQLCPCTFLPDAELISAGREYLGFDCNVSSSAIREQNRLPPHAMNLPASGVRGAVVRSLTDDIAAMMGE